MGIWSFFNWLGGKKRRSLADIPMEDLNRERLTMQGELRKLEKDLDALFQEEERLKESYRETTHDARKRSIARRIQEGRSRCASLETRMSYCSRMLQTVIGLMTVKENAVFFERMGVAPILSQMDIGEVEAFIDRATVEGRLQQEKLAALLRQLDDGLMPMNESGEEETLRALMAELDATVTAEPVGERITEQQSQASADDVPERRPMPE